MNLLLLRGLARDSRHWGAFPQILESTSPQTKVSMIELPGTFLSRHEHSPKSVDGIFKILRGEWLKLKGESIGPWALCGMSLGGMVALHWAGKMDDFKKVIVVNTSSANTSFPWQRMKASAFLSLLKSELLNWPVLKKEIQILKLTTNLLKDAKYQAKIWAELQLSQKVISFPNALNQIIAASGFQTTVELKSELLILSSLKDRMVDPICSENLAKYYNVTHWRHLEAGHDIGLDSPEWLAQKISDFLNANQEITQYCHQR